ncbi:MAG: redoxin domain-containing protein [Trueperaceae bacterium]
MRRTLIVVVVVAALAALFAFGLRPSDPRAVEGRIGRLMPDFEAPVLPRYVEEYGPVLRLSDYLNRGMPVVVNVWASWCIPACWNEAPRWKEAWERYQGRAVIIGLNFQDGTEDAQTFVERFDKRFPSVSDPKGLIGIDWGVFGVPETYFLRPDGTLYYKHSGEISSEAIEQNIEALLR